MVVRVLVSLLTSWYIYQNDDGLLSTDFTVLHNHGYSLRY